jgi:GNAT superfamily N-acetyltransferase
VRFVAVTADDPRLAAFHGGIYWQAFAAQHEPLAVWHQALRGELPYRLVVRLALAGDDTIAAGICYERYPRSGCGLLTYMVVAPEHRRSGLGERLLRDALADLADTRAVFGEIADDGERLARFVRWGARVVPGRYIQPALGPGLARDRSLVLIAWAPSPELPGEVVRAFVEELYAVTEGGPPDPECSS